ncbi:HYC_CC_PP family protein [Chitinophaga varians]|uniref:HYC_CC_PP family protein n=1 Tax=Chitinophaga varians TaxID=2202339 RepID=UPI00165EC663|nr:hypothetical protein [Chitinophaga varians]MBC9914502.1 hypothetical protein [Chitinophaga varians]
MKKFLILILAVLYMGTSTGATFHMHYCKGKLIEVDLWHSEVKQCGKCGAKPNTVCARKCCKDEHKTVKLEKDQKITAQTMHALQQVAMATPVAFAVMPVPSFVSPVTACPVGNAPPRSNKVPAHILHCTYRI